MEPIEPIRAEDGDEDDLSDDSAEDFPLFGDDADDADDADFVRQESVPTGTTPLEVALLTKLDDDKAQDIVLIDLKGKSPMADSMIVASGGGPPTRSTDAPVASAVAEPPSSGAVA